MEWFHFCVDTMKWNEFVKKTTWPSIPQNVNSRYLWVAELCAILFIDFSFRATPVAYGVSQASGWVWAVAASLHHGQATPDPSRLCNLCCCSLRQRQILNPRSKARNWTPVLTDPSWICFCCTMAGTPEVPEFSFLSLFYSFHCSLPCSKQTLRSGPGDGCPQPLTWVEATGGCILWCLFTSHLQAARPAIKFLFCLFYSLSPVKLFSKESEKRCGGISMVCCSLVIKSHLNSEALSTCCKVLFSPVGLEMSPQGDRVVGQLFGGRNPQRSV